MIEDDIKILELYVNGSGCLTTTKIAVKEAFERVKANARLGALLDASSNPTQEISAINSSVPVDQALGTVKHSTVVGTKPFFNGQRVADCLSTIECLARLGAAVEAMNEMDELQKLDEGGWRLTEYGIYGMEFPVDHRGLTAQEALDKRYRS